jgi:diguanylate cyclase (GGDEF)-like protein
MKLLQYRRPSTYLILLSAVILSLGFIMAYYVHITVENLKYDARIINESGIIRGSIQRVTKLVLSDSIQSSNEIIIDVNRLIEQFISNEKGYRPSRSEENIVKGIQNLKEKWQNLGNKLIKYQETHSEQIQKEIIEESEKCWKAADAVVLMAQLATEEKVGGIKHFYIILILNAISAILVILLVLSYVRKKLEYESSHDHLTSLYNRRFYENLIESEVVRSKRYNHPFSLILFDIDFFKNINDKYGHKTGDKVLTELVTVVTKTIRKSDAVFRIGGEEFAIISPETKAEGAFNLAEKVRKGIEKYSFGTNKVTVSLGVAEFHQAIKKDDLYSHADQALYLAKNKGRNRTEVFIKRKLDA